LGEEGVEKGCEDLSEFLEKSLHFTTARSKTLMNLSEARILSFRLPNNITMFKKLREFQRLHPVPCLNFIIAEEFL